MLDYISQATIDFLLGMFTLFLILLVVIVVSKLLKKFFRAIFKSYDDQPR